MGDEHESDRYVLGPGCSVAGVEDAWRALPYPYVARIRDEMSREFALYADQALEWAEATLAACNTSIQR